MFFARRQQETAPERRARIDDAERIYAIGDIHGRVDLLLRLLDRIRDDMAAQSDGRRTRLVFLGDYIDRGDESRAVLETLSRLRGEDKTPAVFLRGNHEEMCLRFLDDPVDARAWLKWGGEQTLASYGVPPPTHNAEDAALVAARDRLRDAIEPHLGFLNALETHWVSGSVVFSHAGVMPGLPLDEQPPDRMVHGHPSGLCDMPMPGHLVVHGHFDSTEPVLLPGRSCVDTGAYYSGVLTALRLDTSETFLSTA